MIVDRYYYAQLNKQEQAVYKRSIQQNIPSNDKGQSVDILCQSICV